jgi:hypothetical protein
MDSQEARDAIIEKILAQRPTLREYLRTMADISTRDAEEWKMFEDYEAPGDKPGNNSQYRLGMAYAYRDIERILDRDGFKPE